MSTLSSYMESIQCFRNSFSLESMETWVPVQALQLSDQWVSASYMENTDVLEAPSSQAAALPARSHGRCVKVIIDLCGLSQKATSQSLIQ